MMVIVCVCVCVCVCCAEYVLSGQDDGQADAAPAHLCAQLVLPRALFADLPLARPRAPLHAQPLGE